MTDADTTFDGFESVGGATGDDLMSFKESKKESVESECTVKNLGVFSHCFIINGMSPEMREMVYWKAPLKTGIVLACIMTLLISLQCISVISVLAYSALAVLSCTFAWRIYNDIMANVRKTNEGHPFQEILDKDMVLPKERIVDFFGRTSDKLNDRLRQLRDMLLVSNYTESVKFGVFLYLLTIVGGWFNLLTLVTLFVVSLFSVPKVYELYQPHFDSILDIVKGHVKRVWELVREKVKSLPVIGKKEKTT